MRPIQVLLAVVAATLLATGCSQQKANADKVLDSVESSLAAIKEDAQRYAPEGLKSVEDQLAWLGEADGRPTEEVIDAEPDLRALGDVEGIVWALLNRGATVAVYAENSGGDTAFQQRLEQDGLANGSSIRSDVIAIFVSLDHYSAIRYGDQWNAALGTNDNYEAIRTGQLNAGLSASSTARWAGARRHP